jgi:hypothetical protein
MSPLAECGHAEDVRRDDLPQFGEVTGRVEQDQVKVWASQQASSCMISERVGVAAVPTADSQCRAVVSMKN